MSTLAAPRFRIAQVELFEAPVRLRMPFRFGAATLTHCQQAWARVRIENAAGKQALGAAAELLSPKWFDKNPALSNELNLDQLRDVLRLARAAYLGDATPDTAFGHFARHHEAHQRAAAERGHNPLLASYGPALLDRAVLDAVCRMSGVSVFEAFNRGLPGIDERWPLFAGVGEFAASLTPTFSMAARHTVGLADPLSDADVTEPLHDGLPQTLQQVIARYGHRHFKLKLCGQIQTDLERLRAIAAVLDAMVPAYELTLDGNEQFTELGALAELLARMRAQNALARLCRSILCIEQPLHRDHAFTADLRKHDLGLPLIVDESDGTLQAFEQARACGYSGISIKGCKGLYKSLLNAARCRWWNAALERTPGAGDDRGPWFLSGEDLTVQPGLALQQDLAIAALVGLAHIERNGHHYVDGMRGRPSGEQRALAQAHADLYERVRAPDGEGITRVRIEGGHLAFASLKTAGFASAAMPDFASMSAMQMPPEQAFAPPAAGRPPEGGFRTARSGAASPRAATR